MNAAILQQNPHTPELEIMRDTGWTAYPSGHHEAGGWASAANVPTANVPTSAKTAHVTFSISVGVRGKNKILNTILKNKPGEIVFN